MATKLPLQLKVIFLSNTKETNEGLGDAMQLDKLAFQMLNIFWWY